MELTTLDRIEAGWGTAGLIDVETTGLDPGRDEVIELSLLLFGFERRTGEVKGIIDHYTGLREPGCSMSRGAFLVHRISRSSLKGAQLDSGRVNELLERSEFLIAHNAGFDYRFVTRLFPAAAAKPWYCSMNGIGWREKGYPSRGLQKLLTIHRIPVDRAHRAGADVEACLKLLAVMNEQGVSYLLELMKGRVAFGAGRRAEER
jgi:DNA polymerase-3 subunit epsilon